MQAKITSLEKSIERHKRSFRSLSEQLEERDTENEELVAELKTCSFILGLFTSNESSGDGIAEQLTVLADRA